MLAVITTFWLLFVIRFQQIFFSSFSHLLVLNQLLLSKPGSQTYTTTTDAAHPVMFYVGWCSRTEFSIRDCGGGILSSAIVTCGWSALGVRCRGSSLLSEFSDTVHMYLSEPTLRPLDSIWCMWKGSSHH